MKGNNISKLLQSILIIFVSLVIFSSSFLYKVDAEDELTFETNETINNDNDENTHEVILEDELFMENDNEYINFDENLITQQESIIENDNSSNMIGNNQTLDASIYCYGVLIDNGDFVIFLSYNKYTDNSEGTFKDINNQPITGIIRKYNYPTGAMNWGAFCYKIEKIYAMPNNPIHFTDIEWILEGHIIMLNL